MAVRRILVTGATGGIGVPLCERLAREGCELILAARNRERLREVVARLSSECGGEHAWRELDFASRVSVTEFNGYLSSGIPKLHGLVVMAPQLPPNSECLPNDEEWEMVFETSFISPLSVIRTALPALRNAGTSYVVIVSGISTVQLLGHYATSSVVRCAWLAEAKALSFKYGVDGIRVNTLSFGGVLTEHYREVLEERARANSVSLGEQLEREVSNVPLRKYCTPEEAANAIATLLSEFASHMSGANLLYDGGFTQTY